MKVVEVDPVEKVTFEDRGESDSGVGVGGSISAEVTRCKGPEAEKDWVGEMSKCNVVGEAEKE